MSRDAIRASAWVAALPCMLSATHACAGSAGTVFYGPGVTSVPALGGYGLIALAGLIALVAFRMRREPAVQGSRFLGAALAVAVIATGASGVKVLHAAVGATPTPLDNPEGGQATLFLGTSCVRNETDGSLFVTGITPNGDNIVITDKALAVCPEDSIDNGGANAGEAPVCSTSPPSELMPQKACSITLVEVQPDPG